MKICQVRAELFHAEGRSDGQTDTHGESKLSLSQNIATDIPTAYWTDHFTIPLFHNNIFLHCYLLLFVLKCSTIWRIQLQTLTSYDFGKTNYDEFQGVWRH
jgi:hypothetical protein